MSTETTEADLQATGYRRYPPDQFKKGTMFFYQKRFRDNEGTQYFVAFYRYEAIAFSNGASLPEQWLMEMNLNEPHCTFQIHRPTDLAFCTQKAHAFWMMMGAVYYEKD